MIYIYYCKIQKNGKQYYNVFVDERIAADS